MKKAIVTTSWDDGHICDIRLADLLLKYDLKATLYISPNNREFSENDLLDDVNIRELSNYFEIGAHTMTHPVLNKISISEAEKEIASGKSYLEDLLGHEVTVFAYPRGIYNFDIKRLVISSGFRSARTIEQYVFSLHDDPFVMPTTLHAYRQYINVYRNAKFSNWHPVRWWKNMDWETAAKNTFDHVMENGGVYHLWGHSWITEKASQWEKLERVFDYVSRRENVDYVVNSNLF